MQFTITINQVKALQWGLNAQQTLLFAFVYECPSWAKPIKVDSGIYYALSKAKIVEELPLLTDKPDTAYRLLRQLEAAGVIELSHTTGITLVRLTDKGRTWNRGVDGSEKYPSKVGKISEEGRKNIRGGSEKSPTNQDTSNQDTNQKDTLGSSGDAPFAYSAEFDEFWLSYPKRAGGNSKKGAFKAWNARIRSGVPAQDLIQAAKRYAEQMQAKGNVGTAYVKQAQTFLGPDEHWREALSSNIRQFPAGKNGRPPLGDGEFYHPDWESGTKIVCHVSTHDPDTGYTLEYMRKRGLI
ncbi:hypothetical protein [Azorhizophilus paspali]|uniref:hypothetical protein n=1 Tax=Azorhizophilus paspali TaxID=69963 RepID=UPI0037494AE2